MVGHGRVRTMNAVLATGARIAAERAAGWNRQLRLTPLPARAYFRAKVADRLRDGARQHRHCSTRRHGARRRPVGRQLARDDRADPRRADPVRRARDPDRATCSPPTRSGPRSAASTALLALLGGIWFPIATTACCTTSPSCLPSYWLVQASHVGARRRTPGARRAGSSSRSGASSLPRARRAAYRRDTARI